MSSPVTSSVTESAWTTIRGVAVGLVFPPVCRLCGLPVIEGHDFCPPCDRELTVSAGRMAAACPGCGLPGVGPIAGSSDGSSDATTCPNCVVPQKSRFAFDRVVAMWSYQDRVCDAIVAAKFARHAALADAMGRRLGQRILSDRITEMPDLVTPIPSHWTRRMTRGGNGVASLAATVASVIDRPCRDLLMANRRIQKQAWLSDAGRRANVHGAFSVKKSYASPRPPRIANQHILVIDDVLTTGATANEIATTLKSAGAQRVTLAVVARAIRG